VAGVGTLPPESLASAERLCCGGGVPTPATREPESNLQTCPPDPDFDLALPGPTSPTARSRLRSATTWSGLLPSFPAGWNARQLYPRQQDEGYEKNRLAGDSGREDFAVRSRNAGSARSVLGGWRDI